MNNPSLIIPYPGPDPSGETSDIYVYLRPETNGVLTESVIMKTILEKPEWKESVKLVYLANYPGGFIHTKKLIEHHYRLKIHFAENGGSVFTRGMISAFEKKFKVGFESSKVLGAFDSLKFTGMNEEELFNYRVLPENMLSVLGQNIKKYNNIWIVTYDIPAILHKNTFSTNIAVMIFRISSDWDEFQKIVDGTAEHLKEAGILSENTSLSRAFHYSKSPWEQMLDGTDYLWGVDVSDGGVEDDISFGAFLMNRGWSRERIRETIRNPLVLYRNGNGSFITEKNIFEATAGMNYFQAENFCANITAFIPLENKL